MQSRLLSFLLPLGFAALVCLVFPATAAELEEVATTSGMSTSAVGEAGGAQTLKSAFSRVSRKASEIAIQSISLIGTPYVYGGNSPDSGLDCSGFVRYVFLASGVATLPRTAAELKAVGRYIGKGDLRTGDLVFYKTIKNSISHVGIYLGDRKFIHAPSTGGEVRIENIDSGYWVKRFAGARRVE